MENNMGPEYMTPEDVVELKEDIVDLKTRVAHEKQAVADAIEALMDIKLDLVAQEKKLHDFETWRLGKSLGL